MRRKRLRCASDFDQYSIFNFQSSILFYRSCSMADYSLEPVDVKKVSTRYRTIQTKIPVPESLAIFASLKKSEPRSMMGMPPVVWDRAENFSVYDKWGNRWIDWSSCVLLANAGH